MKKVILEKPEVAVVELSNVSNEKYYGVSPDYDKKGFITKTDFNLGKYTVLSQRLLTKGNGWDSFDSQDLKTIIKKLISNTLFTVYEFDTSKELFTWLAE
jgi:hypothetical protein